MDSEIVRSTDSFSQKKDISTSELKSIPISTEQELLPINRNKPWRLVIRRRVTDGRNSDEDI
ncbi:MAG: hypothetical protein IKF93_06020 [Lachnospiraceae bacterium]|nr:hypothetical protein [Lachnospiraceae bacterium]